MAIEFCRRLCILKGIHPREPKRKVHGHNKTYYHVKDINFLAHEPLLETGRSVTGIKHLSIDLQTAVRPCLVFRHLFVAVSERFQYMSVTHVLLGRELKVYERKVKKAKGRLDEALADRLKHQRPSYTLDHLVKER